MPIRIVRNDITKIECDAIVNAANSTLLGGGGVDGAIHRAAGPGLLAECRRLGGCPAGQARITAAYSLPCRYVIHTVGPRWVGGSHGERALLESCYRESLRLALENGCESVAFPLISAGAYGYPREEALQVALDTIRRFLLHNEMQVTLVVYDKSSFRLSKNLMDDITEYIDQHYVETHTLYRSRTCGALPDDRPDTMPYSAWDAAHDEGSPAPPEKPDAHPQKAPGAHPRKTGFLKAPFRKSKETKPAPANAAFSVPDVSSPNASLADALSCLDESFTQMLLRKIDEKGITDIQCYKRANVDRKLFSKIRSDIQYKPSKTTAIAFAIALELPLQETRELLMKAGYALSHSNKFDVIIEYFVTRGCYDIFEINEALFAFDQKLLGA